MAWLTPETDAEDTILRVLYIPNDERFMAAVSGALVELTRVWNWEQVEIGDMTAETAAARAQALLDAYWEDYVPASPLIGCIVPYVTETIPANMLPCDGGVHLLSDYPLLAAVLDPFLITSETQFITPNLKRRVIVGADSSASAYEKFAESGEAAHVLVTAELPAHAHGMDRQVTYGPSGSWGANYFALSASLGNIANAGTANAGSNVGHNNMQPYTAINYGLIFQ